MADLQSSAADGVATITLNRPERHNAFDHGLLKGLDQALTSCRDDPEIRVVVLAARGRSFSAGADLEWMKKMASFSLEENYNDALAMADCFHTLASLNKPTIALVQGAAYGGGVGLVAASDLAIAAEETSFCFSEVRLGLIPAVISPYIIQAMGRRAAGRYFLSAETFSALEALQLGLVHRVVRGPKLAAEGERYCSLLLNNSPAAMAAVKERLLALPPPEDIRAATARWIAEIRCSAEGREGISAFLEKRSPSWLHHRQDKSSHV
ncbi:enoyl-CoA hydratase-related protein [Desulfogranum mediterraneum]|uniref:enoyl-CoA hydratase-related protein n=1 Tax=Desulfogranum mediterraneum TaxID=160661 RepID=UPI00041F8B57|nr:enoyl-CoA hydratase-related protein [Desulfogranum mediterraneum]